MNTTEILFNLLSYSPDKSKLASFQSTSLMEWEEVMQAAQKHQVVPILYHRLKEAGITIPKEISNEAKPVFLKLAYRNIQIYQIIEKLLNQLNLKGIKTIALKGAYLTEAVYPNIGLRYMSDIDLLVQKKDMAQAEEVLLASGYKLMSSDHQMNDLGHHFCYVADQSPMVELHWALYETYSNQIEIDAIWDRAQPISLANSTAYTLDLEDQLLFLCLHIAHHTRDVYIQMLIDIDELVKKFGSLIRWEIIQKRAHEWGIFRAVYVVLSLSKELLGVEIPNEFLSSLQPGGCEEKYREYLRNRFLKIDNLDHVDKKVQSNDRQESKINRILRAIKKGLQLSRENISLLYGVPQHSWRVWCYFPHFYHRVLRRNIRTYWKELFGGNEIQDRLEEKYQSIAVRNWLLTGHVSAVKR